MADKRRIMIVFAIAVLFAVFVFAVIEAVYPSPKYEDFCGRGAEIYPPKNVNCTDVGPLTGQDENCQNEKGYLKPIYNEQGCIASYECDLCSGKFNDAQDKYNQYLFYISAILSLIAIFLGLYLPKEKNELNESIGSGFMLGGIFALFFGTIRSFVSLGRFIRPVAILFELILIIYIAYKKLGKK